MMSEKNKRLTTLFVGIIIFFITFYYFINYELLEDIIEETITRGPDEILAIITWIIFQLIYLYYLWSKRSLFTQKLFNLSSKIKKLFSRFISSV